MKTPKRPTRPRDPVELAFQVFQEAIGERPKAFDPPPAGFEPEPTAEPTPEPETAKPEKDPAAVSLGRRGGLKGGKARVAKMTKEELSEAARNAANVRWAKRDEKST